MGKWKGNCAESQLVKSGNMNVLLGSEVRTLLVCGEPFRCDSFAIIVMQSGTLAFQNNFVNTVVAANDIYLISPGTLFEFQEISEDAEFISIGFKRDYLKDQGVFISGGEIVHLLSSDFIKKFQLTNDEKEDLVCALRSLRRKIKLTQETPHIKDAIRHNFLSILYEILLVYNKNSVFKPVKLDRKEELTAGFLSLLGDVFKKEKRVSYYAERLFVTSRHLSTVVKQVTGKTAGEIIDEMVLNEAKVLLSSHLMNVAQVADELHFSDQSFFGKFFKRYTGLSPSLYKANSNSALNPLF